MVTLARKSHRLPHSYFGNIESLRDDLESNVMLVACSDLCLETNHKTIGDPHRFFVLQHLAASIPDGPTAQGNLLAAEIEYALTIRNIEHIVVSGHWGCGVIRNWMEKEGNDYRGLKRSFQDETLRQVQATYPTANSTERLRLMIAEHVLFQLDHLQTHDLVRERLEAGAVQLHGIIFDNDNSRLFYFEPECGQFVAMETV